MSTKPSPEDSDFALAQKEKNLRGVKEINYFAWLAYVCMLALIAGFVYAKTH